MKRICGGCFILYKYRDQTYNVESFIFQLESLHLFKHQIPLVYLSISMGSW